jgi:high-affinity nickel-transport protein
MLGMLVTDGINGYWISRLIVRADEVARVASRLMSLVVAGLSLLVGGFGLMKLSLPDIDAWSEGKELLFGGAVVVVIGSSFLLAMHLSRTKPTAATVSR